MTNKFIEFIEENNGTLTVIIEKENNVRQHLINCKLINIKYDYEKNDLDKYELIKTIFTFIVNNDEVIIECNSVVVLPKNIWGD